MIWLTFVRNSNGSHGTVGRITGFWGARYEFQSQHIPVVFYFIITILLLFYSYQNKYFPPIFSRCFMNWKIDFCRYFVFFYYCYSFPDHIEIFNFSVILFPGILVWIMQRQYMRSTDTYLQKTTCPLYETFRFCETKKLDGESWYPFWRIKFFDNRNL